MGRRQTKAAVFSAIITFVITALIAIIFMRNMDLKNKAAIAILQDRQANVEVFAFKRYIKADHILTADDISTIQFKDYYRAKGMFLSRKETLPDKKEIVNYEKYVATSDRDGNVLYEQTVSYGGIGDLIGRVVKTNVSRNTPIVESLLYAEGEEKPAKDIRLQEINFVLLPSDLQKDDYIDIRIQYPTGENYRVLAGKKVIRSTSEDDDEVDVNTIFIQVSEEELLVLASAVIESYMQDGMKLYATKYVDPFEQLFKEEIINYVDLYEKSIARAIALEEYNKIVSAIAVSGEEYPEFEKYFMMNSNERKVYLNKARMNSVNESEVSNATIAQVSGMPENYVEEIRYALQTNDADILNVYKNLRVTKNIDVASTYPVKKEMLAVLEKNPDVVQTAFEYYKDLFDYYTSPEHEKYDAYYELEKKYATAPETRTDYMSTEKTKAEILNEMEELLKQRANNVNSKNKDEMDNQLAARKKYLNKLLGRTSEEG